MRGPAHACTAFIMTIHDTLASGALTAATGSLDYGTEGGRGGRHVCTCVCCGCCFCVMRRVPRTHNNYMSCIMLPCIPRAACVCLYAHTRKVRARLRTSAYVCAITCMAELVRAMLTQRCVQHFKRAIAARSCRGQVAWLRVWDTYSTGCTACIQCHTVLYVSQPCFASPTAAGRNVIAHTRTYSTPRPA